MTQKVRKWLKRRGLRGGGITPEQDEAAKLKAAADAASNVSNAEALKTVNEMQDGDAFEDNTPASSDKQAIFKKALTEARNAVETALTAYP
jgi:hypothetical protein